MTRPRQVRLPVRHHNIRPAAGLQSAAEFRVSVDGMMNVLVLIV
jgi:hypothetical protein